jgi:predicted KAP-like P-loop ATPase
MTKQENNALLTKALLRTLGELSEADARGINPELASVVGRVVKNYGEALQGVKVAPEKPKQRRTRRKKSDSDIAMATDVFLSQGLTLKEARAASGERNNA